MVVNGHEEAKRGSGRIKEERKRKGVQGKEYKERGSREMREECAHEPREGREGRGRGKMAWGERSSCMGPRRINP